MDELKHRAGLKPREQKELPAEKLLDVLRTIYPEEVSVELFNKLQGKDGDSNAN